MRFKSLRAELLFWLLTPLVLLVALDAWTTYQSARDGASEVQDRMLLGAAKMIGQQASVDHGVLHVEIPPAALELFAAPVQDRVIYRVSQHDGGLLAGDAELAPPPSQPEPDQAVFFDSVHQNEEVRVVAYAQPIFQPADHPPLLIEVGQTRVGHHHRVQQAWHSALRRQMLMLGLVGVLLGLGLRHALQPLVQLRDQMRQRAPGSLEPLDVGQTPTELRPLGNALNDYVDRLNRHVIAHSRFIADASHQLRTPLTVLNTQVVYALRHRDEALREEALQAIHETVEQGMRLVQQLLLHARVESTLSAPMPREPIDLLDQTRRVLEAFAPLAGAKGIDLGCAFDTQKAVVWGSSPLLYEMLSNLVDNALRYTPAGGEVTVRVTRQAQGCALAVEDNGPGIPPEAQARVFERFYRLGNATSDGCGLGLAIVKDIATAMQAQLHLRSPIAASGPRPGLSISVIFPAAESA